nr:phage scaffolding protein [uncultured Solibaculum sp.]
MEWMDQVEQDMELSLSENQRTALEEAVMRRIGEAIGQADQQHEKQMEELRQEMDRTSHQVETLRRQRFDEQVDRILQGAKAKNRDAVLALVDLGKVELSDQGDLTGLQEQINALRASDGYLFEEGCLTGSKGNFGREMDPMGPMGLSDAIARHYHKR